MKELTMTDNWNDAATSALKTIWELSEWQAEVDGEKFDSGLWTVEELREDLDLFIESQSDDGDSDSVSIEIKLDCDGVVINGWWAHIGMDAVFLSGNKGFPLTVESVQEVLVRKQQDYGHENIRRFGLQGLLVRIHDKVARLENLLTNGGTPNNESIEDTLLDIVGYSAIGIMWEKGEFMLDLKPV